VTSTATRTPIPPTRTPNPTPTRSFPLEGRGPTGFEEDVNPLTGLELADPALLDRRPVMIKIENLPRAHRPQWGLSVADLVYEYYTEFGATRFAAVFYGEDAERVGPIRSGRFFDSNIVQMYKAIFVYGMAYPDVQSRFITSNFANRLIFETNESCPALCRFDPNGQNLLVANTAAMSDYLVMRNVDNTRQNLDGMFFKLEAPQGGSPASQVFIRYSGAIYNRWDYDATSGTYLRFSDKENDIDRQNEVYEQLTDRLNGEPIARQNVAMLCVPHEVLRQARRRRGAGYHHHQPGRLVYRLRRAVLPGRHRPGLPGARRADLRRALAGLRGGPGADAGGRGRQPLPVQARADLVSGDWRVLAGDE
jgi:hypothetical protein